MSTVKSVQDKKAVSGLNTPYRLDMSKITLGDLEVFDRAKEGNVKYTEILAFLDKILIDQVATDIPLIDAGPLFEKIGVAINDMMNPNTDPEGKETGNSNGG